MKGSPNKHCLPTTLQVIRSHPKKGENRVDKTAECDSSPSFSSFSPSTKSSEGDDSSESQEASSQGEASDNPSGSFSDNDSSLRSDDEAWDECDDKEAIGATEDALPEFHDPLKFGSPFCLNYYSTKGENEHSPKSDLNEHKKKEATPSIDLKDQQTGEVSQEALKAEFNRFMEAPLEEILKEFTNGDLLQFLADTDREYLVTWLMRKKDISAYQERSIPITTLPFWMIPKWHLRTQSWAADRMGSPF